MNNPEPLGVNPIIVPNIEPAARLHTNEINEEAAPSGEKQRNFENILAEKAVIYLASMGIENAAAAIRGRDRCKDLDAGVYGYCQTYFPDSAVAARIRSYVWPIVKIAMIAASETPGVRSGQLLEPEPGSAWDGALTTNSADTKTLLPSMHRFYRMLGLVDIRNGARAETVNFDSEKLPTDITAKRLVTRRFTSGLSEAVIEEIWTSERHAGPQARIASTVYVGAVRL